MSNCSVCHQPEPLVRPCSNLKCTWDMCQKCLFELRHEYKNICRLCRNRLRPEITQLFSLIENAEANASPLGFGLMLIHLKQLLLDDTINVDDKENIKQLLQKAWKGEEFEDDILFSTFKSYPPKWAKDLDNVPQNDPITRWKVTYELIHGKLQALSSRSKRPIEFPWQAVAAMQRARDSKQKSAPVQPLPQPIRPLRFGPTWFEDYFRCTEQEYQDNRDRIRFDETCNQLTCYDSQGEEMVTYQTDDMNAVSQSTIKERIETLNRTAWGYRIHDDPMTFRILLGTEDADCTVQLQRPIFNGGVFLVASQFNALEMRENNITPASGITIYQEDKTQGPLCAMTCAASLFVRQYVHEHSRRDDEKEMCVGQYTTDPRQTQNVQVDLSQAFFKKLAKELHNSKINVNVSEPFVTFQNGYVTSTNFATIGTAIDQHKWSDKVYKLMQDHLTVGVHRNAQVWTDSEQVVTQVFASALPLDNRYSGLSVEQIAQSAPLARLFLKNAIEMCILEGIYAKLTKSELRGRVPVILTEIGCGVFGNDSEWFQEVLADVLKNGKVYGKKYTAYPIDLYMSLYGGAENDSRTQAYRGIFEHASNRPEQKAK